MRRTLRGLMSAPTWSFWEYAPQAPGIKRHPSYTCQPSGFVFCTGRCRTAFGAKTHQRRCWSQRGRHLDVALAAISARPYPESGMTFSATLSYPRCILPEPCPVRCSDGVFRDVRAGCTHATKDSGLTLGDRGRSRPKIFDHACRMGLEGGRSTRPIAAAPAGRG